MSELNTLFSGRGLHSLFTPSIITNKNNHLLTGTNTFYPPNFTNPLNTLKPSQHFKTQGNGNSYLLSSSSSESLPSTFDWRTEAKSKDIKLGGVKDQKTCGDCWSMSSSSVLSDRFNIKNKNSSTPALSPLNLMACSVSTTQHGGCLGGSPINAGHILETYGITADNCASWSQWCQNNCSSVETNNNNIPECCSYSNCNVWYAKPGSTSTLHGTSISSISTSLQTFNEHLKANITITFNQYPKSVQNQIKHEIFTNGPVVTSFFVFNDFQTNSPWSSTDNIYIHGSYSNPQPSLQGGHAVEIIGWGIKNNVEYWIVKNSWGSDWNDKGYFNIAMTQYKNGSSSSSIIDQTVNGFTGIDTPFTISANGQSSLFGGVTFFEPDLSRQNIKGIGPEKCKQKPPPSPPDPSGNFFQKHKVLIIIICISILIILLLSIFV